MGIVLESINKKFISDNGPVEALENVNISLRKGEFVSIIGPSGCGKSTLLNIIAGLESQTSGKVFCNGKAVSGAGPERCMIFQEAALFPWLRVIDNVAFGLKMSGISKVQRMARAREYLKMVHLDDFQDSFVHELSGGMRQRVALARALTLDSEVLLMDEPFAALDSHTRYLLHLELQEIWLETKKNIVFVTHSVEEAVLLADRVIVMASNPGRIKKELEIKIARPRLNGSAEVMTVASELLKELQPGGSGLC